MNKTHWLQIFNPYSVWWFKTRLFIKIWFTQKRTVFKFKKSGEFNPFIWSSISRDSDCRMNRQELEILEKNLQKILTVAHELRVPSSTRFVKLQSLFLRVGSVLYPLFQVLFWKRSKWSIENGSSITG